MRKSDVRFYSDGYGAHPAVCVKVHHNLGCSTKDVMEKFGCSEEQAEKALQFAFDAECVQFWEHWQDDSGDFENGLHGSPEYAYFPGHKVTVSCEGRSGGWLVVYGLPEFEEWDAVLLARWNRFQNAVLADVKYRTGAEALMSDIDCNEWWKEHSVLYNHHDAPKGEAVCIADVKADVIAYAQEKYGFVPALP
jgi:hypothetical protein